MSAKKAKRKSKKAAANKVSGAKSSKRPAAKAGKKKAVKRAKSAKNTKAGKEKDLIPGMTAEKQIPGATFLGLVEDFFAHVGVVAITLQRPLAVSDTIRIKGHTTDIIQKVESMEIDHKPVQMAAAKDAVGVKIVAQARKGDAVYKI